MRCWWVVLFVCMSAKAQVKVDVYSMSLANANVCSGNGSNIGGNPAIASNFKNTIVGTNQLLPFGLRILGTNAIFISGKIKNQNFAFGFTQSSLQTFREQQYSLSTGMRITQNMSVGLKLIGTSLKYPENDKERSFIVEFGVIEQITNKLSTGIHLRIKTNSTITLRDYNSLRVGILYKNTDKLPIHLALEVNEYGERLFCTGIEYLFKNNVSTKIGWNISELSYSFGFDYTINKIKIYTASNYHNVLGLSYGIGMSYEIQK